MSLNQSMNIAINSMKNNQYGLTVVSQNIANMHVDGYHRQRLNFVTNQYTTNCENVISTIQGMNGASVSSLSDYVDKGAFKNFLNSNSDAQYYNTLADNIGELEDVINQLGDDGLNSLLNDFFAASADLEKFPTDLTIRQQYVLAAQNVCNKFNEVSNKCASIQEDKFNTIGISVNSVNTLLSNLAQANQAHVKNNQGITTQTEIDSILQELSSYMDIKTDTNENGTINVYIGNVAVVQGGEQKYSLEADFNSADSDNAVKFSLKSLENPDYVIEKNVNEAFSSGSLKAHIEFLNGQNGSVSNINDIKNAIDSAANAFATELNKIQTYNNGDVFAAAIGANDDGSMKLIEATENMFTTKDGSATFNASNIQVNSKIVDDPFLVSAARIDKNKLDQSDDWTKAIGNSDNAVEITKLQNANICTYNNGKNKCTLNDYLTNSAAKVGMDISSVQSRADTAQDILDIDKTNYSNIIGVNLDEELADMIKYQRAFEASAKIFSTVNDIMGAIISMV